MPASSRTLPRLVSLLAAVSLFALPALGSSFGETWYRGEAEVTSYTLEQARYGEIHEGEAVLVFVTEDFSRGKHIKLDRPGAADDDRVKVLKLNFTKTFDTGVYPYSMMTSVFTPVDVSSDPTTIKVTTTSQEWCGHTFTQLNRRDAGYRLQEFSYFESEGDFTRDLDASVTEDGLWTLLRIDPQALPTGRLRLIPGSMYQRLSHAQWLPREADAALAADPDDPALMTYTLDYPELRRTLTIRFQKASPHEIESWEETYVSGWGAGAKRLTTRATKKERMMLDYWNRNSVADGVLRERLALD